MHGLWYWRLNIERQYQHQNYKWHSTHMNPTSISILTQSHQFVCFRHALHCVLEGSLALSIYGITQHDSIDICAEQEHYQCLMATLRSSCLQ